MHRQVTQSVIKRINTAEPGFRVVLLPSAMSDVTFGSVGSPDLVATQTNSIIIIIVIIMLCYNCYSFHFYSGFEEIPEL